jgi:hypothetical protein
LTERSRVGEFIWPRKYFWATMFVAFCDHDFGNSTFFCSNATLSPWPMRASRVSHSTCSKGWTPGCVNSRWTLNASPMRGAVLRAVSGVDDSIEKISSSALRPPVGLFAEIRGLERFLRGPDGLEEGWKSGP